MRKRSRRAFLRTDYRCRAGNAGSHLETRRATQPARVFRIIREYTQQQAAVSPHRARLGHLVEENTT